MNTLSNELLAQLFAQESNDPFLILVTMTHSSFSSPIRFVNNQEQIISRGNTFQSFPVKITLPIDDGDRAREVSLEMDNVSLEFIDELRSITTAVTVKLELVLASLPDQVQMVLEDLKINSITYNKARIIARLIVDDFLNTELTCERYSPNNFPGIF